MTLKISATVRRTNRSAQFANINNDVQNGANVGARASD